MQSRLLVSLTRTSFVCMLMLVCVHAHAAEVNQRLSAPSPRLKSNFKSSLRFEATRYATEIPKTPELTNSQYLNAKLEFNKDFNSVGWLSSAGDFSLGSYFKRSQTQVIIRELYLSARLGEKNQLFTGRKKSDWSEGDAFWQLGLWQPKYAMDALKPEQQGLTGLLYERTYEKNQTLVFISPIFIPTFGPDLREEQGSIVSDSRWYRPISEISFGQRVNSLVYKLDIPEIARLALNPSLGASSTLALPESNLSMRFSAIRKPVNDLILRRKNFKRATQDRLDITVQPDITYHNLYGSDFMYKSERLQSSLSISVDAPEEKRPEVDQAIQKLKPMQVVSLQNSIDLSRYFSQNLRLKFGHLRLTGGEIEDITREGLQDDVTLFDRRWIFSNTTLVGLSGDIKRPRLWPMSFEFKYMYDQDQRGSMVNTEWIFKPQASLGFVIGADFLGVDNDQADPAGFLNQFRANDRFYTGMTYVF